MFLKVIEQLGNAPVSVDEAKAHCRIDNPHEDGLIAHYIDAAVDYAEEFTRRSIVRKKLLLVMPFEPSLCLPRPPMLDVMDVTLNGAPIAYQLDFDIGRLQFCRPATGELKIIFEAGYTNNIPSSIKQGILAHVAQMYEYRGDDAAVPASELGKLTRVYYHQHRIMTIGARV